MMRIDENHFRLTVNHDLYEGTVDEKERLQIDTVNGKPFGRKVAFRMADRLVDFLHEVASLTGTKFGCGIGDMRSVQGRGAGRPGFAMDARGGRHR